MKKELDERIKRKEEEWQEQMEPFNSFWDYVKEAIGDGINSMMYNKKPTDKGEKIADQFIWFFKIVVIFFALKGFTYWLTGR